MSATQKPGNALAGAKRSCACVPGTEVSLGRIFEDRILQLGFYQKLFQQGVLLLQLGQPFGLLGLHPAGLLPTAVLSRLSRFDDDEGIDKGLALGNQLL